MGVADAVGFKALLVCEGMLHHLQMGADSSLAKGPLQKPEKYYTALISD